MMRKIIILLGSCVVACSPAGTDQAPSTSTPASTHQDAQPLSYLDMKLCTQDSDCVLASGVCQEPEAVNKAHIEKFQSLVLERQKSTLCAPPTEYDAAKISASCQSNSCVVQGLDE